MENEIDILENVEKIIKETSVEAEKNNRKIFKKYPIAFSFLSLLGFSSVLYGFEKTFDQIRIFKENPLLVLLGGLFILLITGTIYKWLQNKEIN